MTDRVFELPAYGWTPRRDQMPVWNALMRPDLRKAVIVASRRWGKDEMVLAALSCRAMDRVGSYLYCLPAYEQARKVLWEMVNWRTQRTRVLDFFPDEIVERRDSQSMKLFLSSGSTVQFVGSDAPDSLVGGGYAGIVMSEAALSDPRAMLLFQPILEESGGWSASISTPRGKTGRGGSFYKDYLAAKEDMEAGDPTAFAAYLPADKTGLFPPHQLLRIQMDLIRTHGKAIGDAIFNQEYLCSWDSVAVGGVWSHELTEMELEGRVRPAPHDRRYPVFTAWDLGISDLNAILVFQIINGKYILIDAIEQNGIGLDTHIQVLKHKAIEHGYSYAKHFGPHDLRVRDYARGASRVDEAKRMGLNFTVTPQARLKTQIAAAAQLIRNMVVNSDSPGAMHALERFKGWAYVVNKSTGQVIDTPAHSEASHSSSALCTFALNMAKDLGVSTHTDGDLHPDTNILNAAGQKFDPRNYGPAPGSHPGMVSDIMRAHAGHAPTRGAFG
jgi:hypothetical protein